MGSSTLSAMSRVSAISSRASSEGNRRSTGIRVCQTFSVTDVREGDGEIVVIADVGGGGFNGRSTFTFRLAPDGASIERMTITA